MKEAPENRGRNVLEVPHGDYALHVAINSVDTGRRCRQRAVPVRRN